VPLLGRFRADLYAPSQRLVIEVDGANHAEGLLLALSVAIRPVMLAPVALRAQELRRTASPRESNLAANGAVSIAEAESHFQNDRLRLSSKRSSRTSKLESEGFIELEYAEMSLRHPKRNVLLTRFPQERERTPDERAPRALSTKIGMNPHGGEEWRFRQ